MKLCRAFLPVLAGIVFVAAGFFADDAKSANGEVVTPPVYVPDTSQADKMMPGGVFAWNSLLQTTNAAADQEQVHFTVCFTNISGGNVTILNVHPSCGCTTAELPPLPWTIPPGTQELVPVTVNVAGKTGMLFKSIVFTTDKGYQQLDLRINMLPPVVRKLTDAERAQGVAAAKIDRQAVFHADCATCHVQPGEGRYGEVLFQADCAICHEAEPRATMVPDLHQLKVPTNEDFWRTWIAHGKPGSFMPAFAQSDGGPLTDMQIASLAAYLNYAIPSHVPPSAQ